MISLHPISENPPPERTRAFWTHVRFFIETIWALFGGPEAIAGMHNLARGEHALLSSWLRRAEALMRKLLVIEAAKLKIEERKYKSRTASKRELKLRQFFADEPHLWRVAFRITEGTRTFSRTKRKVSLTQQFPDAWPLAERFEALLRVFDAPEAYVIRLARQLRRAPNKVAALTSVPLFDGFEDIFEPLCPLLCEAHGAFCPSDTS